VRADAFGELAPLGLLDLVAEQCGRELMRFIEDNEIPVGCVLQEQLKIFVAGEPVEPGDEQVMLANVLPVAALSIESLVSRSNLRWNFSLSSCCHCSRSEPGATIRHRRSSARTSSSRCRARS